MSIPKHHLDPFAADIAELLASKPPDTLLTTRQLARLLHLSVQWFEIGRLPKDPNDPSKGHRYGPPFIRFNKRVIRYRLGDVIAWLHERSEKPEVTDDESPPHVSNHKRPSQQTAEP
jgi:hypothetical protein